MSCAYQSALGQQLVVVYGSLVDFHTKCYATTSTCTVLQKLHMTFDLSTQCHLLTEVRSDRLASNQIQEAHAVRHSNSWRDKHEWCYLLKNTAWKQSVVQSTVQSTVQSKVQSTVQSMVQSTVQSKDRPQLRFYTHPSWAGTCELNHFCHDDRTFAI